MVSWMEVTGVWLLMLIAAIINGGVREKFLNLRFGQRIGHWISTVALCLIILAITYFYMLLSDVRPDDQGGIVLGSYWAVLTIGFEFLFGHYIAGHPWRRLLADYNIFAGRIWILVLITTVLAPWLCGILLAK